MNRILLESLVLVFVAVLCGTGFHSLRTDKQAKIAFIGTYNRPYLEDDTGNEAKTVAVTETETETETETDTDTDTDTDTGTGTETESAPVAEGPIREIQIAEAKTLFEDEILFLDARRTEAYELGHIRGARSMPIWEGDFDDKFTAFLNHPEVDPGMPVVVYCMSKNCEDSHMLAERLQSAGFEDLMVYKGGYPEWEKAGHPVEKGPQKEEGDE